MVLCIVMSTIPKECDTYNYSTVIISIITMLLTDQTTPLPAAPTALSLEEQRLMLSIETLNQQIKGEIKLF